MKALKVLVSALLALALCLGLTAGACAESGEKIPYGEPTFHKVPDSPTWVMPTTPT